ncbi:BtpA/SgcQ family protein [Georgenia sp. 10Sc9-8]|uniref:BtpA/SgcQ family protein n=1 Tax=Georgenia halotolerans TaxID=3028317 RepID=A0ABT5U0B4_9MICO|nr:BtpA/SgcQ family protein [Georgenia halotolerans]
MGRFRTTFPHTAKPLIAMAHVPALPGTPLYDGAGMGAIIEHVQRDVRLLVEAGFDAVLFCNENDRPYELDAGPESAAFMTRVVTECRPESVPYGVDFLWDPKIALATAVATGASFMREVTTGVWESDMGLWNTNCAKTLRDRRAYDRDDLAVFMNITPEFASPIGTRTAPQIARSTVISSLADVILVSGPMAGSQPDVETVAAVREAVPADVPVLLNTGAKKETIAAFLEHADGAVVGSALKVDGDTWNPVDPERAQAFVTAARTA